MIREPLFRDPSLGFDRNKPWMNVDSMVIYSCFEQCDADACGMRLIDGGGGGSFPSSYEYCTCR